MESSHGRDSPSTVSLSHSFSGSDLKDTSNLCELTLTPFARETLSQHIQLLQQDNMSWDHLNEAKPQSFSIEELTKQFSLVEGLLDQKYEEERANPARFFKNNESDLLKIALEQVKIAILEAALASLKLQPEEDIQQKPSNFIHGLYYFLLMGGTWIAYLHGYDAAEAISQLLPFAVPTAAIWTAGSLLFLAALGIFAAFEAEELSKHLGFKSVKNLETTLNLNQKQIELTHEFAKRLAIHSEEARLKSATDYESYFELARKCDQSIHKVQKKVERLEESKGRKMAKTTLLVFGMVFTACDEIFLAVGFGALALSGPWGWIIIAATAIIGAALFYAAHRLMIRDKVAPALKQKEEILDAFATYQKDELLPGIQKKLDAKKHLEQLEQELFDVKQNLELIQSGSITDKAEMIKILSEKEDELKKAKIRAEQYREELGKENVDLKNETAILKQELNKMQKELIFTKRLLKEQQLTTTLLERENQRARASMLKRPPSPFSPKAGQTFATMQHASLLINQSTFRPKPKQISKSQQIPAKIMADYF